MNKMMVSPERKGLQLHEHPSVPHSASPGTEIIISNTTGPKRNGSQRLGTLHFQRALEGFFFFFGCNSQHAGS